MKEEMAHLEKETFSSLGFEVRWSHSKSVTRKGKFCVAGTLDIVSQDFQAGTGTWFGSCSIVSTVLKCIQFSSIRGAGEPGSGTVTNSCNYAKSGSTLKAEQQSWVPCWTEVRVIECWNRLAGEAVESLPLEVSKTQLGVGLCNLI